VIQAWQDLLSQLDVIEEEGAVVCNMAELNAFESKLGIILPEDYKTFCQVFGSGQFGDGMSISCISNYDEIMLNMLRSTLEDDFDTELDYRIARGESLETGAIQELLDMALVFGGDGSTDVVLWDLRTYSPKDMSYDIYMSRIESFPGVCKLGRSFTEFVETFCLGIKPFRHFPDWTHPDPQALYRTFTRVLQR